MSSQQSQAIFFFFPLIIALVTVSSASAHRAKIIVHPTVAEICSKTSHNTMCMSAVQPRIHTVDRVTPGTVLELLQRTVVEYTNVGRRMAGKKAWSTKSTGYEQRSYAVCHEQYNSALDSLEELMEAVGRKDEGTAKTNMDSLFAFYSACDDSFTEKGLVSPLEKQNSVLAKMVGNLEDVFALL